MAKHMWILLACLVSAAGQAATKDTTQWRCRNRKLSCKKWAADNQCTANYPFMAEGVAPHPRAHGTRHTQRSTARDTSQRTGTALDRHSLVPAHATPRHTTNQPCTVASCMVLTVVPCVVSAECPAACDLCTNAGLAATPAPFELDYVCRGKLQHVPARLEDASHAPDGCGFHCRDNMTSVCAREAARDACKTQPDVMRVQCPATCGVCKALGLRVSTEEEYCKPFCEDAEKQAAQCAGWAASGECIKNFPFMSQMCGRSCGLCGAVESAEEPAAAAAATKKKGKKGKKKAAKPGAAAPDAEAAQPAAEGEEPAGRGSGSGGGDSGGGDSGGGDSGGGDAAKPGKRGFVGGMKAALGKVGDAFKGKKADETASKAEL